MFEWDEEKRLSTLKKHGIDFFDAARIFLSPYLCLPAKNIAEDRMKAVGIIGERAICVVFTMRGDTVRLITARAARKDERESYQTLLARSDSGSEGPDELG